MTQEQNTKPAGERTHTPGPWTQNADTVWRGKHETVCHPVNHPQSIADARLIAAAPDLLIALEALLKERAACEKLLAMFDPGYKGTPDELSPAQILATAAIAKATLS